MSIDFFTVSVNRALPLLFSLPNLGVLTEGQFAVFCPWMGCWGQQRDYGEGRGSLFWGFRGPLMSILRGAVRLYSSSPEHER